MKNFKLPLFIIIAFIVVILGVIAVNYVINPVQNGQDSLNNQYSEMKINNQDSLNNQYLETKKSCKDLQIPYDYLEEYEETVPYTDRECETKELAYSITNFVMNKDFCNKKEHVCKDTFLGFCTDKIYYCVDRSVSCSVNLKNLDIEERGIWEITFSYLDDSTKNMIKSEIKSEFLYPQTEKILISAINLIGTGIEGNANKNVTCNYQATNVPTKQVCRDVTKYKEVTKTRTIVKYRVEKNCE